MSKSNGSADARNHDAPGAETDVVEELAAICDRVDVSISTNTIEIGYDDVSGGWKNDETGLFVGAVVHDRSECVVLLQNQWSDGWILPGGAVEPNETLEHAATREVAEETGLTVTIEDPIIVERQIFTKTHSDDRAIGYFVLFEAVAETTTFTNAPGINGETIRAVEWVSVNDISEDMGHYQHILMVLEKFRPDSSCSNGGHHRGSRTHD